VLDFARNHFELLGLPARYALDAAALDEAYRALQRQVHPDRHAASDDASRRLALQAAARVNEAYRTLSDPVERARYLLGLHGVDALDETDTALDVDFLERQLERRERAAGADEAALETLIDEVRAERAAAQAALGDLLDAERNRGQSTLDESRVCSDPSAADTGFGTARARLRELKFLDKLAGDLDEMLAQGT
jgi:molecular chaperone HscB